MLLNFSISLESICTHFVLHCTTKLNFLDPPSSPTSILKKNCEYSSFFLAGSVKPFLNYFVLPMKSFIPFRTPLKSPSALQKTKHHTSFQLPFLKTLLMGGGALFLPTPKCIVEGGIDTQIKKVQSFHIKHLYPFRTTE